MPSLFRKYQWLISLTFVVALAVTVIRLTRDVPIYRSSTTLEFPIPRQDESAQQFEITINNHLRILITTEIVSKARAGISRPIEEVTSKMKSISANHLKNTSLVQLTVDSLDPVLSSDFANSWANAFLASLQNSEKEKYRIVEQARPSSHPITPGKRETIFIASLIGLGAGIGLAFLLELQKRRNN